MAAGKRRTTQKNLGRNQPNSTGFSPTKWPAQRTTERVIHHVDGARISDSLSSHQNSIGRSPNSLVKLGNHQKKNNIKKPAIGRLQMDSIELDTMERRTYSALNPFSSQRTNVGLGLNGW